MRCGHEGRLQPPMLRIAPSRLRTRGCCTPACEPRAGIAAARLTGFLGRLSTGSGVLFTLGRGGEGRAEPLRPIFGAAAQPPGPLSSPVLPFRRPGAPSPRRSRRGGASCAISSAISRRSRLGYRPPTSATSTKRVAAAAMARAVRAAAARAARAVAVRAAGAARAAAARAAAAAVAERSHQQARGLRRRRRPACRLSPRRAEHRSHTYYNNS